MTGMRVAVGAGVDVMLAVPVANTGVFKGEDCQDGAHPDKSSRKQAKRRKFDDIGQSLIIFI